MWVTPTGTYEMAARFTPGEMAQYQGGKVTSIWFHSVNKNCTIRLYGNGTANAPGALLHEEVIANPGFSGWHEVVIPLASLPTIGSGDVWISYEKVYTGLGDTGIGTENLNGRSLNASWQRINGGDWTQAPYSLWKLKMQVVVE
jgi:hypothetical protein